MNNTTIEQFLNSQHTTETVKSYMFNINHFLKLNPKAKSFKYSDVVNYLSSQKYKHQKQSMSPVLAAIKKYYDYLIYTGVRNDHPCKTLKIKRVKKPIQVQNLFTSSELEELLNRENRYQNLEIRNKVIISFLIYQGITSQELIRIDVNDIDLDTGTVYIKSTAGTNKRTLELNSTQGILLYKYINEYRNKLSKTSSKRLLLGIRGDVYTVDGINRMLRPLKYYFSDRILNATTIRQSVIANWLNVKKIPIETVQQMSGQKYPSSTEKYKTTNVDEQRKLINQYHLLA